MYFVITQKSVKIKSVPARVRLSITGVRSQELLVWGFHKYQLYVYLQTSDAVIKIVSS